MSHTMGQAYPNLLDPPYRTSAECFYPTTTNTMGLAYSNLLDRPTVPRTLQEKVQQGKET